MEKLLDEQVIDQIKAALAGLQEPVEIVYFSSKADCQYCRETQQLLEELAVLDDKLTLRVYDLEADKGLASEYGIDKAPGLLIGLRNGDEFVDLGICFSGLPSGYEFGTLINAILLASKGESGLSEQTRDYLTKLDKPLLLQVFVTPT